MSLNIKSERVHDLARDVARRTGVNQTEAVRRALEGYLARLDAEDRSRSKGHDDKVSEILSDMRARAGAAGEPDLSTDDLYDEAGLPR